jgi:peptide/nickel transport system substrate-binding protein
LVPSAGDWLEVAGREAWISGESGALSGVRIYNDSEFSLTIDAEHLPNVWEAAMFMGVGPNALHAYGLEAHDDGDGVFLTGPGRIPLTFEALNLAVNGGTFEYQIDEETGEYVLDAAGERIIIGGDGQRYRPTVFSGPYMFESVDVGNSVLSLVVNPHFPGTWDGFRPRIERIIWRFVPVPLIVDALAAGEVHMNVAMAGGENLQNAFATLINIDNPSHTFFNYPQHGQSLIQFHTDFGPTQFREVRQAMSYLIDRYAWNEIVNRGFATVPHGPYGAAWWWYQEAMERGLRDRLVIYGLNISRAIELLESGGWNYTATGEPFVGPGNENHIRHKWVDGELMPLEIRWVVTPDPSVGRDTLNLQLPENMAYAGMRLVEERSQRWAAIMQGGYREEERFHMYQLTVGMATIWAPWLLFSLEWIPQSNWGQVDNPVTRELADRFRVLDITTPEGHSAFVDAFIDFMVHLNHEAYTIPMSMSLHHDFIPTWLGGWFNTGLWTFPEAIQRSYIRG